VAKVAMTFTQASTLPTTTTGMLWASTKKGAKNAPYQPVQHTIVETKNMMNEALMRSLMKVAAQRMMCRICVVCVCV
jgi:hypothetical protein